MKKRLAVLACLPMLTLANNFHVEPKYIETGNDFGKLCAKQCPALNYGLIGSSDAWVQHTINKSVLSVFGAAGEENSPQDLLYKAFAKIDRPSDKELSDFLKASEKNLISEHKKLLKAHGNKNAPLIDISARPTYLGHRGDLELFAISEFYQFGNQVGTGSISYFVFDIKRQKRLSLDDVLLPDGKEKLTQMVKDKFYHALKKGKVDIANHEKTWAFYLTKNFIFSKDGLKFLYQPEQITPYNMGMPEFVIRYADLADIVKAEYL
ncbi:MAG: RsiV family protein [Moraxella sp.]|nr:RsiV family protein [Moraxella sp.]